MGGDLLRVAAQVCAKALHPMFTNAAAHLQVAIQDKGSQLMGIPKGNKPPKISNQRDVALADITGKNNLKTMRSRLQKEWGNSEILTQYGSGLNEGSTVMANLALTTLINCAPKGKTAVVLFFDVVAAFARVLRALVVDHPASKEVWAARLRKWSFKEEDTARIMEEEFGPARWSQEEKKSHLLALTSSVLDNSWSSVANAKGVMEYQTTACAGMPKSDVLFNRANATIIKKIHERLDVCGILETLQPGVDGEAMWNQEPGSFEAVENQPISLMDDMAQVVYVTPESHREILVMTTTIYVDAFAEHGVILNMKPGNRRVLLSTRELDLKK